MKSFPRQVFVRLWIVQMGVWFSALVASYLIARFDGVPSHWKFLLSFSVVAGALFAWTSYAFVFPLSRLMAKVKSILSSSPESISTEDFAKDSFGEWTEIEADVDAIGKDLEKKRGRLDRERVELATVIGSMSDAILAVDSQGSPLYFNSRFAMLFKSSRTETWKLWDVIREPSILEAYEVALKKAQPGSTRTVAMEFEKEGKRHLALTVSPLLRANGTVYGAVGIFHDVTEMKLAEQMRIDFVANVSHELRTPLTSIKGYTDTIQADLKAGKKVASEFVEVIAKNSNRLMSLITDLLDLSSIESQSQSLHLEPIETSEISNRIVGQITERFSSKSQNVQTVYDVQSIEADSNRLEQILVNLLDNAHKYTPEGGQVTLTWTEDAHDVILKVSNTGPGISPEHQLRLFERFYRVDKARSRELGGTGLGLAIVKHIMQKHEGSVSVESTPGMGATFVCRFPKIRG